MGDRYGRSTAALLALAAGVVAACSGAIEPGQEPREETRIEAVGRELVGASVSVTLRVPDALRAAPFDVERQLRVPPDFRIEVFARVSGARFMALAPDGQLLVSVPSAGKVVRIAGNGKVSDFLTGLARPHDLVFHTIAGTTYLYVSEKNQVRRYAYQSGAVLSSQVVVAHLPDASLSELRGAYGHELKNIALDGQDRLFVSIASASNADPRDLAATPKRGSIYVYAADGTGGRPYAQGLRNAEGLTVASDGALWAVVNQRDNLLYPFHGDWDGDGKDDYGRLMQSYVDGHPPEALVCVRDGGHYGWPFCNPNPDRGLSDMPFDRDVETNADGRRLDCSQADRITRGIQAHSAPLGLSFLPEVGARLPSGFSGALVSAYHGCWNCSQPFGYKVAIFPFEAGRPGPESDLVTGFSGFGRPVDVVSNAAGEIYISDDAAGAIYKLTYGPPASPSVSKLVLLDVATQQPVPGYDPLIDGVVLDRALLGSRKVALRAYTIPDAVGSVRFTLDGSILATENARPYCIAGDDGTRCQPWKPPAGSHTLTITPFAEARAAGQAGTPLTIRFTAP